MQVCILMSTYNGETYLREQIESLISQVGVTASILVRDDGSSDNTVSILKEYSEKGILNYYLGENLKPASSFFKLLRDAEEAEFYAFCDQDDYWEEQKLNMAISKLAKISPEKPALYFSKAQLVDEKLKPIDGVEYPTSSYNLGTALLRNNATGCTMVFNKKLKDYVIKQLPRKVMMHDHWIYLMCLALDGEVIYDENSYIKYRQHGSNVCGISNSLYEKFKKSGFFDNESLRQCMAMDLLNYYYNDIPEYNLEIIKKVALYKKSIKNKLELIFDSRIKANSLLSDVSIITNIVLNKL